MKAFTYDRADSAVDRQVGGRHWPNRYAPNEARQGLDTTSPFMRCHDDKCRGQEQAFRNHIAGTPDALSAPSKAAESGRQRALEDEEGTGADQREAHRVIEREALAEIKASRTQ
jgi:hypothetical protein